MIQDNVQTLDRFQGCLLGAAIGDALGMPAESMTQTEILLATKGQGITDFIAPIQTKIPELRKLMAGRTTDDWQLAHAVAPRKVLKNFIGTLVIMGPMAGGRLKNLCCAELAMEWP